MPFFKHVILTFLNTCYQTASISIYSFSVECKTLSFEGGFYPDMLNLFRSYLFMPIRDLTLFCGKVMPAEAFCPIWLSELEGREGFSGLILFGKRKIK